MTPLGATSRSFSDASVWWWSVPLYLLRQLFFSSELLAGVVWPPHFLSCTHERPCSWVSRDGSAGLIGEALTLAEVALLLFVGHGSVDAGRRMAAMLRSFPTSCGRGSAAGGGCAVTLLRKRWVGDTASSVPVLSWVSRGGESTRPGGSEVCSALASRMATVVGCETFHGPPVLRRCRSPSQPASRTKVFWLHGLIGEAAHG